jgi:SNF2 family DNA or RNA helicase
VAYSVKHGKSINADEMGLGKTLQAIASAETVGEFPVLITCPASLRGNWLREIARWTPWRTAAISDGHTVPDTDYVVVSYEGMTKLTQEG